MCRDVWGDYVSPDDFKTAARNGICKSTVKARVSRAWKARDAVTVPVAKTNHEYRRYKKMAAENGISNNTFKRRVQRGWALDVAATMPLVDTKESLERTRKSRKRVIPKKTIEEATKNGICYNTLYSRILRGIPPEQAARDPVITLRNHPWRKCEGDRVRLAAACAAQKNKNIQHKLDEMKG